MIEPRDQNLPGKIGEVNPAGYTQEIPAKSSKDHVAQLHLRPYLVLSWYGASGAIRYF